VTVSRPARLAVGGEVGLRGSSYTITALAGGTVALAGVTGEVLAVPVAELLTDSSFTVLAPRTRERRCRLAACWTGCRRRWPPGRSGGNGT
jgi:hypothetical protein